MTVVNTLILYSLSFTILAKYINITISITHAQLHASSQHSDTHLVAFLASSCPQTHKDISHIPFVTTYHIITPFIAACIYNGMPHAVSHAMMLYHAYFITLACYCT